TKVQPGDEAEFALETYPGQIIKVTVDSPIRAIGPGPRPPAGTLPMGAPAAQPPGQFAVKFNLADRDRQLFLAAGASGDAAIYTQHTAFRHIRRQAILL